MTLKIVSVVGARPQFVKAAVVSRALSLSNRSGQAAEVMVHTGQHYDENMSDLFFRELGIPAPVYNLGVGSASHGAMTGRMLERIEQVLQHEKPSAVLVYGDTNSTLAGALAAIKQQVPVAHVESGLRSRNPAMAEEVNRVLTDRISRWLFCPTAAAVDNLREEGVAPDRIFLVGDVMFDSALHYGSSAQAGPAVRAIVDECGGIYCLATVHRAETTDDPERLRAVMRALDDIAAEQTVLLPLHPRTRARMQEFGIEMRRVRLLPPVGYLEMIALLRDCQAVFTDSGGVQKEAFFFRRSCITLRTETEWTELVALGANIVAGTDDKAIVEAWHRLHGRDIDWDAAPYGDGGSGPQIVEILVDGLIRAPSRLI